MRSVLILCGAMLAASWNLPASAAEPQSLVGKDAPDFVLKASNGSNLRLSVSDAGYGVPESIREHLFEPFATGRPDGTGLGLAMVREVADAHGGRAFVQHRNDGTTFTLEIPIGPSP